MSRMNKDAPQTLYVVETNMYYPFQECTYLEGKETLESAVRDNGEEQVVGVYQLVRVEKYKKVVTKTAVLEKVE